VRVMSLLISLSCSFLFFSCAILQHESAPRRGKELYHLAQSREAVRLLGVGAAYLEGSEYLKGFEFYQKALTIFRSLARRELEGYTLAMLGFIAHRSGHSIQAKEFYEEAIKIANASSAPSKLWEVNLGMGKLEEEEGQLAEAITFYKAGVEIAETGGGWLTAEEGKGKFLKEKMAQELYESFILLLLRQGKAEEAFTYLERFKAMIFFSLLQPLAHLHLRVYFHSLSGVQVLLDTGTTLLEYFPTANKTVIWIVNQSMVNVVEVPLSREALEEKVRNFRKAVENPDGEYEELAKELYTLLIWPLISQIQGERLGIIPHGILHYLPFQALFNGTTYLAEEYSIFYAPSASLFALAVQKRKEKGSYLLAFGNDESGEVTSPLLHAEEEVLTLASLYSHSTVYIKGSARKGLVKTLSKDAHILHLASYGQLLGETPLSSHLRFARDGQQDGKLEIGELFTLDLQQATLVVLSASQTLVGPRAQGDELTVLVAGFLYAGSPSVLLSFWNVNSGSNVLFMDRFHSHLKQKSKAEALRFTQLEMLRGEMGNHRTHPFFWASFILMGDWE